MRLNTQQTIRQELENHKDATTNKEGALAFKLSPKEKLYQIVLTTLFGEAKFYGKQDSEIIGTLVEVAEEDPEFILKLASYARNEMYLRTVPQVLLVEAANSEKFKGKGMVNAYTKYIVRRADEITETLGYHLKKYGKPVPNSLIRGLKPVFRNFDEYQLAKYNRKGAVSLKDAVRIVHPKPENKERAELYKRILDDALKTPDTWEVVISTKGSTKENWESIIPKMGYMALLRNLRNFLAKGVDMKPVIKVLTDAEKVKRSKQLPFRFFSAYREIEESNLTGTSTVLDAINDAMELSVNNLPTFKGTTFMSADNSGSMHYGVSGRSKVCHADIANLMQAIALKLCENAITSVFGQDFKVVNTSSRSTILDNMKKFKDTDVGHATNGHLAIEHLLNNKIKVDRILVFTDAQIYNSTGWNTESRNTFAELFKQYKKSVNPNAYLYLFDLNGYGDTVIPRDEPNVVLISGWSEKVLKFVECFEKDKNSMLTEIEGYKPK